MSRELRGGWGKEGGVTLIIVDPEVILLLALARVPHEEL